jgi:hypothetical protein
MSTIQNPAELRRRGIEVLVRELGYADAMRFLQQFGSGSGDYTQERRELLASLTDQELLERAEKARVENLGRKAG